MEQSTSPWVIILAAGSGTRLAELTVDRDGVAVPKQFCSLRGGRSLLVDTVGRALQLATRDRVVVVVAREHARWWEPQLGAIDAGNIVVQPRNRGTGAGLLLPLAHVLARDPGAVCAVLPSDHHVARVDVLRNALAGRLRGLAAGRDVGRLTVFGITPDGPDTEYGWIVPGAGRAAVESFVEKPDAMCAAQLMARGALWNSFLLAGRAQRAWDISAPHLPDAERALRAVFALPVAKRPAALASAYESLPSLDFSRIVLERSAPHLHLVRVPECGWTDLGSPRRVADCIAALQLQAGGAPPRAAWYPTVDLHEALRGRDLAGVRFA